MKGGAARVLDAAAREQRDAQIEAEIAAIEAELLEHEAPRRPASWRDIARGLLLVAVCVGIVMVIAGTAPELWR